MLKKNCFFNRSAVFTEEKAANLLPIKKKIIQGTTGKQHCALLQDFNSHFCGVLKSSFYSLYSHQRCRVQDRLNMRLFVVACLLGLIDFFFYQLYSANTQMCLLKCIANKEIKKTARYSSSCPEILELFTKTYTMHHKTALKGRYYYFSREHNLKKKRRFPFIYIDIYILFCFLKGIIRHQTPK